MVVAGVWGGRKRRAREVMIVRQTPFEWPRDRRRSISLSHEAGVYALFLRDASALLDIEAGREGLLYIGMAANREGLRGRCHFHARTRNHSPRKSLAVLLMERLDLNPVLIKKLNSADTWGLDAVSDTRLSEWMHEHLHLAVHVCVDPDGAETELVGQ